MLSEEGVTAKTKAILLGVGKGRAFEPEWRQCWHWARTEQVPVSAERVSGQAARKGESWWLWGTGAHRDTGEVAPGHGGSLPFLQAAGASKGFPTRVVPWPKFGRQKT